MAEWHFLRKLMIAKSLRLIQPLVCVFAAVAVSVREIAALFYRVWRLLNRLAHPRHADTPCRPSPLPLA